MSYRALMVTTSPITILLLTILPPIIASLGFLMHVTWGVNFVYPMIFATLYMISLNYLYRTGENPEKDLRELGSKGLVREYHFLRNFFYPAITIFVLLTVLIYYPPFESYTLYGEYDLALISLYAMLAVFPSTIVVTLRFLFRHAFKNLHYCLAAAYFKIGYEQKDELKKFKHLVLMLNTYNKFLERNLKVRIKEMQIHSLIISAREDQGNAIMQSIGEAFKKNDKLELIRKLAAEVPGLKKEEILIKESRILNQAFKEVLTVIIPAVIAIISSIIAILSRFGITI